MEQQHGKRDVWRRYLRFWGADVTGDVNAELQFHVESRVAEYIARGLSPEDARQLAERRFGSVDRARESCVEIQTQHARAEGRAEVGATLLRDVLFALRMLRRQALPSAVAAACIALGIGATTAMFSVGNTLLLRPLPFPNGDRLVEVGSAPRNERRAGLTVTSLPDLADWRARQRVFTQMAGIGNSTMTVVAGDPVRVSGAVVTANAFQTLGVTPESGRLFRDGEDLPGVPPVALVSHRFAERQLGGAASVVGKTFRIAGTPRTIVGVIPDRWAYPTYADAWLPLGIDPLRASRGNRSLTVLAELRPGVRVETADREMAAIGAQMQREQTTGIPVTPFVVPLRDQFVGPARPALLALGFGTALILLIACANVAALQLARATARTREIAVRCAIGASRGRVLAQLLTESVVLAFAGGAAGVGIAYAARNVIARAVAANAPPWMTFDIDARALGFAMLASLAAAIVFGIAPAARLTRIDPAGALAGMRGVLGIDRGRLQRAFVALEIALAVVLVLGAELAVQSVARLRSVPLGFDPAHIVTFRIAMQGQRYGAPLERTRALEALEAGVAALPSVESVSATTYVPTVSCCSQFGTTIDGQPQPPGKGPMVTGNMVTPGFFRTMRIPILAGRDITSADDANAPRVVVINETFAKRYWAAGDALGHRIDTGNGMATIVGIVGDIKQGRLIDAPEPQFYRPHAQDPWADMDVMVRLRGSSPLAVADVRRVARAVDPMLPIDRVNALQELIDRSLASKQLLGGLLAAFAAVALGLAAVGVYAIMSFFVSRRTQELGLRMALGAEPGRLLGYVMRQAIGVATVGAVAGLGGGALAARGLEHLLFGVRAAEPLVYVTAIAAIGVAALAASYGPARRARSVDPMIALRAE